MKIQPIIEVFKLGEQLGRISNFEISSLMDVEHIYAYVQMIT